MKAKDPVKTLLNEIAIENLIGAVRKDPRFSITMDKLSELKLSKTFLFLLFNGFKKGLERSMQIEGIDRKEIESISDEMMEAIKQTAFNFFMVAFVSDTLVEMDEEKEKQNEKGL